jgi:choline dehydrogenase-like flavoprotein
MAETYDVIIIGSGAGGGTLARHLAPSGKRVL